MPAFAPMSPPLDRLLRPQRGDLHRGLLLFAYLLLVICAYVVGQVARDALFLGRFDASRLPYVDVSLFVVVALVVAVYVRAGRRLGLERVLTWSLAGFGVSGLAFAALARGAAPGWLFPVVYLWVGVFGVLAPAQVWTLANYVLAPREARRLFGFVGAGATLGATIGGFLSTVLTRRFGTESLLVLVSGLILLSTLLVRRLWRVRPHALAQEVTSAESRGRASLAGSLGVVAGSPHLRAVAGIVLLSSLVTALSGWQMKAIAQQALGGKDALAAFFGAFNFWVGLLCLATQVLLTAGLLRRFGLSHVLLLLPLGLLAGSAGLLVAGSLAAAVLLRGVDKVLRYSIDRPAVELLYLPVSPRLKLTAKSFIDTVVWRAGDGLAGLAVLAFTTLGGLSAVQLSYVNLPLLLAWLWLAAVVHRRYVTTLEESLKQHRLDAERADTPVLDRETADVLASGLAAVDPTEILYALDLMRLRGAGATLHPAVPGLVTHPHAGVRRRTLALLGEAGDRSALKDAERLLDDADVDVRTEALLYLSRHSQSDPLPRVQDLGGFQDFSVRAALVGVLTRLGGERLESARPIFELMAGEPGETGRRTRLEAARLAERLELPFDEALRRLLEDEDDEIARTAIRAAGKRRSPALVDGLVARLGRPSLCEAASDALVVAGALACEPLARALGDPLTAPELRRSAVSVLGRIGGREAAELLLERLLDGDGALRLRVLVALGRLQDDGPGLELDLRAIEVALGAEILGHYRSYQILGTLASQDPEHSPIAGGLRSAMREELERIFRLLDLLHPRRDFRAAWLALQSGGRVIHDQALDLLESLLPPGTKALLVPLVDPEVPESQRHRLAERLVGPALDTPEGAVSALVATGDPWLRSCAAYAIGALSLRALAPHLDSWAEDPDPLLRETVRQARERLAAQA